MNVNEWIQLSLKEYEQIASLCNIQTSLSNHENDSLHSEDTMQSSEQHHQHVWDRLSDYSMEIEAVRTTHSLMKASILHFNDQDILDDGDNPVEGCTLMRRRSVSQIQEAFRSHVELSERVIRTIMRSTGENSNSAMCGALFPNGIIRTVSERDHSVNIVALASLRASVTRLKNDFGR